MTKYDIYTLNYFYSSEQQFFKDVIQEVCAENTWWSRKCQESCYTMTEFVEKRQRRM